MLEAERDGRLIRGKSVVIEPSESTPLDPVLQ